MSGLSGVVLLDCGFLCEGLCGRFPAAVQRMWILCTFSSASSQRLCYRRSTVVNDGLEMESTNKNWWPASSATPNSCRAPLGSINWIPPNSSQFRGRLLADLCTYWSEPKTTPDSHQSLKEKRAEQTPQNSLSSCDLASKTDFVIFTIMLSSPQRNCRLWFRCVSLAKWSQWRISVSLSHSLSVRSSCVSQGRAGVGGKTPQCHQLHTGKPRYLNKA